MTDTQKGMRSFHIIVLGLILSLVCSLNVTASEKGGEKRGGTSYIQMEPLVMNIASGRQSGFLRVAVCIELSDPSLAEKVKAKDAVIRDALIMLFSSKTPDVISSPEGKTRLRNEIAIRLGQIIGEGSVKGIFFTDFVMQ